MSPETDNAAGAGNQPSRITAICGSLSAKSTTKMALSVALKGASEDLKEKIFSNMSSRAATMLKEEIDYLGPVRLSAVEQAQQQIVDVVRRLEDAGEVVVGGAEQTEQFIE